MQLLCSAVSGKLESYCHPHSQFVRQMLSAAAVTLNAIGCHDVVGVYTAVRRKTFDSTLTQGERIVPTYQVYRTRLHERETSHKCRRCMYRSPLRTGLSC